MTTRLDDRARTEDVDGHAGHRDRAVAELHPAPHDEVVEQRVVRDGDADRITRAVARAQGDEAARCELDAAFRKVPGADLRPGQVGEHRDLLADLGGGDANLRQALEMLLDIAVTEVQSHHVDTGREQVGEHPSAVACGAERGHDLRSAGHF